MVVLDFVLLANSPDLAASYWLRVPQVADLPLALHSIQTLPHGNAFAFSYQLVQPTSVRVFHPLSNAHAGRTKKTEDKICLLFFIYLKQFYASCFCFWSSETNSS
jgi:hypothetical protein